MRLYISFIVQCQFRFQIRIAEDRSFQAAPSTDRDQFYSRRQGLARRNKQGNHNENDYEARFEKSGLK